MCVELCNLSSCFRLNSLLSFSYWYPVTLNNGVCLEFKFQEITFNFKTRYSYFISVHALYQSSLKLAYYGELSQFIKSALALNKRRKRN
jgi:hypothetical protein